MTKYLSILSLVLSFQSAYALTGDVVIGTDERVQITATPKNKSSVYDKIGHLISDDGSCTGTLVASNVVLTAAHCIYSKKTKDIVKPESITFIPGRKSSSDVPFGMFTGKKIVTYKEYILSQDSDYDMAIIILSKTPSVGFLEIAESFDHFELPQHTLSIAGYAGDKEFATLWESSAKGATRDFWSNTLTYTIDTEGGQSGSAIRTKIGGVQKIIGVHTTGSKSGNSGMRFNPEVYATLKRWLRQAAATK